MATSSFTKDFTLKSKKAAESFGKIVSAPAKSIKIDRAFVSADSKKQGETKLKQMLSR